MAAQAVARSGGVVRATGGARGRVNPARRGVRTAQDVPSHSKPQLGEHRRGARACLCCAAPRPARGDPASPRHKRLLARAQVQGAAQQPGSGPPRASLGQQTPQQRRSMYTHMLLCSLANALSDMDKVCLSVAIVPMAAAFGWTAAAQGAVQSAFFWGFTLSQVPGGAAASRYTGKRMLALGVLLWSVGTLVAPMAAASVPLLCLTRMIVGLGEGFSPTATTDMIARYVPRQERARAVGIVFSGFNVGNVVGLLVTPPLIALFGWQAVFYAFGAAGAVWLAVWLALPAPDEPVGAKKIGRVRLSELPWRAFAQNRTMWGVSAAHFADSFGKFTILAWLPTFFVQRFGASLSEAALYSLMPPTIGILVAGVASTWVDAKIARGEDVTSVRRQAWTVAALGPAVCLTLAALAPGKIGAVLGLTVALGSARFALASLFCIHQDLSKRHAPTLLGITSSVGSLGGIVGTALTGLLLKASANLAPAQSWALSLFAPIIVVYLVGYVAWAALVSAEPVAFESPRP
uniref:Major facilitator superfamily (MFS) profile domain-containing protein n=1 Tax=Prasinoderma singulare TaxID=676789 RepID=A0A7S3FIQ9_9VIRI